MVSTTAKRINITPGGEGAGVFRAQVRTRMKSTLQKRIIHCILRYLRFLQFGQEDDIDAHLARAAGAAGAVHKALLFGWQTVVYHHVHPWDVQAAGSHVCCNDHLIIRINGRGGVYS